MVHRNVNRVHTLDPGFQKLTFFSENNMFRNYTAPGNQIGKVKYKDGVLSF